MVLRYLVQVMLRYLVQVMLVYHPEQRSAPAPAAGRQREVLVSHQRRHIIPIFSWDRPIWFDFNYFSPTVSVTVMSDIKS